MVGLNPRDVDPGRIILGPDLQPRKRQWREITERGIGAGHADLFAADDRVEQSIAKRGLGEDPGNGRQDNQHDDDQEKPRTSLARVQFRCMDLSHEAIGPGMRRE